MSSSGSSVIRVGAIGCGQFMSQQHIQTIARSGRLVLQHLADIDPIKLDRVATRYRPVRHSTVWEEVVADPEVDVVVAGVVPNLHPKIARACIERGKPVYIEKPLAPTTVECLEVAQLAELCKVPVAVGFNRRFAPATVVMKQAIQAAGAPVSAYYRIADDDRVRPPDQHWKTIDRLLTETVHIFDLFSFLFTSEPVELYARESRPNDALVTIDYANGSRAAILSSSYASLAQPKEHLEVALGGAYLEMDDFVEVRSFGALDLPAVLRFAGRPYDDCDNRHVEDFARDGLVALIELRRRYERALRESGVLADSARPEAWVVAKNRLGTPPPPQINYASDKGWGAALESFCVAAMAGMLPGTATARDGNRATSCAVAARQSIASGLPVKLDPRTWMG